MVVIFKLLTIQALKTIGSKPNLWVKTAIAQVSPNTIGKEFVYPIRVFIVLAVFILLGSLNPHDSLVTIFQDVNGRAGLKERGPRYLHTGT